MILLTMMACVNDKLDLESANHLGLGLDWTVVVSDNCENGPFCNAEEITEILEVVDQTEGVVTVSDVQPASFILTGVEVGSTQVTVVALDSEREVREQDFVVTVEAIDSAELLPTGCTTNTWPHDDPVYVPPGTDLRLAWSFLDASGGELQGSAPFTTDLTVVSQDVVNRMLVVTTSDVAGASSTIETSAVSGTLQTVTTYDVASFDGIVIRDVQDGPVSAGIAKLFQAMPSIGSHVPCMDDLERALEVSPPGICSLADGLGVEIATTPEYQFNVWGVASGTCTVSVTIGGFTETADFEVL